mmetsp:Transcript_30737/g.46604  ORF Transcript_30737/g.46604 Transcript_30737/m.46604 type:complete len:526 (-) Transcript_30737:84-1661(-)
MINRLLAQRALCQSRCTRNSHIVLAFAAAVASVSNNLACSAFQPIIPLPISQNRLFSAGRTNEELIMTEDAMAICREGIHAVDPTVAIRRYITVPSEGVLRIDSEDYNANDFKNIVLLAFGKASSAMATACLSRLKEDELWSGLPLEGAVILKDDHGTESELNELEQAEKIVVQSASHPVPDQRSVDGAKRVLALAEKASEDTLVLVCISGGGSALFCEPQSPLTLQDLQETNSVLLGSGLSIEDMNVIRKRIETGKGGRLAAAAYPGKVVTMILSDIVGDPLDLIASGPTVLDQSRPSDALNLIQSNPTLQQLPSSVIEVIKQQAENQHTENPSLDAEVFERARNILVGNNQLAVLAAASEAEKRGYKPVILGTRMEGESCHVAGVYASIAQHIIEDGDYKVAEPPCALIAGGETTVTLSKQSGKGGRNQEFALAAALRFQELGLRNVVLASVGTDGTDGPTDAAGAIVDGGTIDRLAGSASNALEQHDAYPYLDQVDESNHSPLIKTGPTGTNVADISITLIR